MENVTGREKNGFCRGECTCWVRAENAHWEACRRVCCRSLAVAGGWRVESAEHYWFHTNLPPQPQLVDVKTGNKRTHGLVKTRKFHHFRSASACKGRFSVTWVTFPHSYQLLWRASHLRGAWHRQLCSKWSQVIKRATPHPVNQSAEVCKCHFFDFFHLHHTHSWMWAETVFWPSPCTCVCSSLSSAIVMPSQHCLLVMTEVLSDF